MESLGGSKSLGNARRRWPYRERRTPPRNADAGIEGELRSGRGTDGIRHSIARCALADPNCEVVVASVCPQLPKSG